ncbi:unnamed protein product, partial [Amoebophrya sp. A120]
QKAAALAGAEPRQDGAKAASFSAARAPSWVEPPSAEKNSRASSRPCATQWAPTRTKTPRRGGESGGGTSVDAAAAQSWRALDLKKMPSVGSRRYFFVAVEWVTGGGGPVRFKKIRDEVRGDKTTTDGRGLMSRRRCVRGASAASIMQAFVLHDAGGRVRPRLFRGLASPGQEVGAGAFRVGAGPSTLEALYVVGAPSAPRIAGSPSVGHWTSWRRPICWMMLRCWMRSAARSALCAAGHCQRARSWHARAGNSP